MYRNNSYLCNNNQDYLDYSDYKTERERDNTGSYVDVTYYRDGSSRVHFGGPCGHVNYDKNGEEC